MKTIEEIKFSPFYEFLFGFYKYLQYLNWIKRGRTPPTPPHLKTDLIKKLASEYSINTLIETGTYLGTTAQTVKNNFSRIFTIEINHKLYQRAKRKFRKNPNIYIKQGDSSKILPKVLKKINSPCLFWLDAHYSGGITAKGKLATPIISELQTILNHRIKKHLILIDDARDYKGKDDYPTIYQLKKIISNYKYYNLKVELDIIIIYPKI